MSFFNLLPERMPKAQQALDKVNKYLANWITEIAVNIIEILILIIFNRLEVFGIPHV
jgi:hypothetical protein